MAADTPDQNLSQYFSVCNDFIHAARLREGNVLIHCLAGMSRSVTVAVAYIMTATNLSWKEALKVVRAGRAVANPNVGFQTQLQEFETYRLVDERRRLRERFPSTALEQLDRSKCSAALDNYQELLQNRDICEGNCTRGEKCPTGAHTNENTDSAHVEGMVGDESRADSGGAGDPAKRNIAYMVSFAAEQWKSLRKPKRKQNQTAADNKDIPLAQSMDALDVGGELLMENVVYYSPIKKEEEQNDETKIEKDNDEIIEKEHAPVDVTEHDKEQQNAYSNTNLNK